MAAICGIISSVERRCCNDSSKYKRHEQQQSFCSMAEHVENICRAFAVEAGAVCDSRLHGHGRGWCACGEGLHGHASVHRAYVPRAQSAIRSRSPDLRMGQAHASRAIKQMSLCQRHLEVDTTKCDTLTRRG